MRCAAKEEQRQAVFFFLKSKFTFFSSDVSHVCRQGISHSGEGESFCFLLLFLRLNFFGSFSRHPFRISLFLMLFCFCFSRLLWCVLSAFPGPGLLSVQYFSASVPSAYPALPQHSAPPGSCTTASSFQLEKMKGTSVARPWRQMQLNSPAANPPPPSKGFENKLKLCFSTKNIQNNPAFFGSSIQIMFLSPGN